MISKCSVCGRTHAVNKGQVQMPSLFCAKHYTGNHNAELECSKFAEDTSYVVATKVAEKRAHLDAVDGHVDMTVHVVDSISKLGEMLYPGDAPPIHDNKWPQNISFNTEPSVLVPINKAVSKMIADHGYAAEATPPTPVAKRPKSMFQLAQLVSGPGHETKPWFIIETNYTSDGPRTRMCGGRWATRVAAQAELEQKERWA